MRYWLKPWPRASKSTEDVCTDLRVFYQFPDWQWKFWTCRETHACRRSSYVSGFRVCQCHIGPLSCFFELFCGYSDLHTMFSWISNHISWNVAETTDRHVFLVWERVIELFFARSRRCTATRSCKVRRVSTESSRVDYPTDATCQWHPSDTVGILHIVEVISTFIRCFDSI